MCEFCTKHGEGKKWYLQMENYSNELLHEQLSSQQKDIAEVSTRVQFIERAFENFVIPAIGTMSKMRSEPQGLPTTEELPSVQSQEFTLQESYRSAGYPSDISKDEVVVHRKIEHFGQVLPIEDIEAVTELASSITRLPCGCRFISTGKTDKRYCLGLGLDRTGIMGKFPDAASSLEVLEKEEAKKILRKLDEEGLMHSIWTGVTPYVMGICNCDRDCLAYSGYIKGHPSSFFRAEYICQTDLDLCTGCKDCMSQCQFGAMSYSSALGKVYIDPSKCFGCGVCRAACSFDAISLLPRQEHPVAADLWLANAPG